MPKLLVNPQRIKQIFLNLLSNSIKFIEKEHGIIEISCFEDSSYWFFHIKDNGIGIDIKYQQKIFEIFNTLKQKKSGTGIGLSIVKNNIGLYGGKIWVESTLGEGATFIFTLSKELTT